MEGIKVAYHNQVFAMAQLQKQCSAKINEDATEVVALLSSIKDEFEGARADAVREGIDKLIKTLNTEVVKVSNAIAKKAEDKAEQIMSMAGSSSTKDELVSIAKKVEEEIAGVVGVRCGRRPGRRGRSAR